ncbi:methyl-accepting chemotaxis protein [Schinkia sp. CFF1]
MKATITRKMYAGFGAIILLLMIMAGYAYYQITATKNTYENLLDNRVEKMNLIRDMLESSKEMELGNRGYLLFGDEGSLNSYEQAKNKYIALSNKLASMLKQGKNKKLLQQLDQYADQYIQVAEKTIALKKANNPEYISTISNEGPPIVMAIQVKAQEMEKFQWEELAKTRADIFKKVNSTRLNLLVLSIFVLLLGCGIAFFISRMISKPVKNMAVIAEKIAGGDLTQDDIEVKTKDEIADLAHAFNDMTQNLREVIQQLTASAEQVASASQELEATSEQATVATEHIASTIQEVANGSEIQVESTGQSATAMEEVSVGIQRIAEFSLAIRDSAHDATTLSEQGNQFIQNAIAQMDEIEQETQNTMVAIKQLTTLSLEIGTIIETITNIADQTNLLALNAAIEAARAGEHGKGFTVVAEEVRKLAEQSRSSAAQIVELINEVQKGAEAANEEMEKSTNEVVVGKKVIHQTGESFQKIMHAVEGVNQQIQEISATSEQLSANTEEVAASVEQLAEIAKDSSKQSQNVAASSEEQLASMEEITASSESLRKLAEDLRGIVTKFKI